MSFWATYLAALQWNKFVRIRGCLRLHTFIDEIDRAIEKLLCSQNILCKSLSCRQTETQILRFLLRAHAPIVGGADALSKEPPERTSLCSEYLHVLAFTSARISGQRVHKSTTEAELTQSSLLILWATRASARTLHDFVIYGPIGFAREYVYTQFPCG